MSAKNFTCKDCGSTFTGGPATRTCPNCGSSNIKVGGSGKKIPGWAKIAAIIVAAIVIIILLLQTCGGSKDLSAKLKEEPSSINIELTGVSKSHLKDFRVQVLNGPDIIETLGFSSKTNIAVFDKVRMLVGTCYNFRIVTKEGRPAEVRWTTGTQYCMATPPPAPVISDVTYEPDRENKVYTVTIVIADSCSADSYSLSGRWQSDNVFRNVTPGHYVASAKNKSGESEKEIILQEIKELPKPLTLQEIQNVLDAVSNGRMTPSAAQDKLAAGNVNLIRPVATAEGGSISTLWSVLQEAQWGTRFKVRNFQNDPNTNKIKSGSLDISIS